MSATNVDSLIAALDRENCPAVLGWLTWAEALMVPPASSVASGAGTSSEDAPWSLLAATPRRVPMPSPVWIACESLISTKIVPLSQAMFVCVWPPKTALMPDQPCRPHFAFRSRFSTTLVSVKPEPPLDARRRWPLRRAGVMSGGTSRRHPPRLPERAVLRAGVHGHRNLFVGRQLVSLLAVM